MKLFVPNIRPWNKAFLLLSATSLFLDPLFFYVPVVNGTHKCLDMDQNLKIIVCVLRSFADVLYLVRIFIQLTTEHVRADRYRRGWRFINPRYGARGYLKSYDFFIDVLASLPLPQLAVLVIIPNLDRRSSLNLLKLVIFSQFLPRVIRLSLLYKKVTKIPGSLTQEAWAAVGLSFFLYVLASHVVGALWYLFAIESQLRCWNIAFEWYNHDSKYLHCGEGHVGDYWFLNISCPLLQRNEIKDSKNFDFGIFLDGLRNHVLETRDLTWKVLYCSFWGLQNLTSLGLRLTTSTYYEEILFVFFIKVMGVTLLALLTGTSRNIYELF